MLKRLLDRFRGWREKRASLQYLADVESRMFFEYAKFQLKDMKRREELRKQW